MPYSNVRRLGLMLAFALFLGQLAFPPVTSAQLSGNSYTSADFSYTITWPDDWFFVDQSNEIGYESIVLSNGSSQAVYMGGPLIISLSFDLESLISGWSRDWTIPDSPAVENLEGNQLKGTDMCRAYAVHAFTRETDDGVTTDRIAHFDVRQANSGNTLSMVFETLASTYDADPGLWDGLVVGVDTGCQSESFLSPAPDQPSLAVIESDQWRFSIASAKIDASIPMLGLDSKQDRDWIAIVADVTNVTGLDASFNLRDPLVQTAEMTGAWDIAPSSTRQVARQLQFTAQDNDSVDVAAGTTARVVLVYSIPAGGSNTTMLLAGEQLPLDDLFELDFDPDA